MKKVLIITYYWPPAGGPGVQRVLKFAKYLPYYGWQPIILTVKNGNYPSIDLSLTKEIPDNVIVHRIPIWEPHYIYSKILRRSPSDPIPVAVLAEKENLTLKKKLMHWIRLNIFIPDARIGWYWPATRYAKKLLKREEIDLVLVSSPPQSLQLIGINLKKTYNIPLVSDFRDPWTEVHYLQNQKRLKIAHSIDLNLEKKVLREASVITTVSPSLARKLNSKVPEAVCRVIYNGYDLEDFSNEAVIVEATKFTLAYIGNFKANQNVPLLWESLKELISESPDFAANFILKITGKLNRDIEIALRNHGLAANFINEDYVPHAQAIRRMYLSSVLLFVIPQSSHNEGILTGKLFDYLKVKRPILSIGPPAGDAAAILTEVQAGPMFDYNNKEGLKAYLRKLYLLWKENKLDTVSPNIKDIMKFDRKILTRELTKIMDSLVK